MTGRVDVDFALLDEMMINFMSEHGAPGAALGIARNGVIVYTRGFGLADSESGKPVQPDSLFRIASVSKPITAIAVLQLCDQKRLQLDDNPFRIIGIAGRLGDEGVDPRLGIITVEHLLLHAGGWDSSATFDPVFAGDRIASALGLDHHPEHSEIIEFMLTQPLQFSPGEQQQYSNFGYLLLGRVIEAVTDQSYNSYVRDNVLTPLGIDTMQQGGALPEDRFPGEVVYYDSDRRKRIAAMDKSRTLSMPYTFMRRISDANGGWIASAPDLLKIGVAFDDPERCSVLSPEMCRLMNSMPHKNYSLNEQGEPNTYVYGLGWEHRPRGWDRESGPYIRSHDGRIPGTSAILVRRDDGITWAALFNADKSAATGRSLANTLRLPMHKALSTIRDWNSEVILSKPDADGNTDQ